MENVSLLILSGGPVRGKSTSKAGTFAMEGAVQEVGYFLNSPCIFSYFYEILRKYNRVVRKLQFLNNFLIKKHFLQGLSSLKPEKMQDL
jgi:hypothetical protein